MLKWAMENVTEDGQYQMILGNHEDNVICDFHAKLDNKYSSCTEESDIFCLDSQYAFDAYMYDKGFETLGSVRQFVEWFEKLPLYKKVTVTKPNAPITGVFDAMEVTIERRRKEYVILSLGSDLGDRENNILTAEDALEKIPGITEFKRASIYETEPVGLEDQPYFLNTCVGFYTDIEPFDLLDKIHVIENDLLRTREIHWGPRTIDIDIIFYGDQVIMKPELTIPHPRWNLRSFVTVPLRELKDVGQDHPDDKEVSLYRKRE